MSTSSAFSAALRDLADGLASERATHAVRLNILLARMQRGALLPSERDILDAHVRRVIDYADRLHHTTAGLLHKLADVKADLHAARAQLAEVQAEHAQTCETVVAVYEAATGHTGCAPGVDVVADVTAVRALHQPVRGQGHTAAGYGTVDPACSTCGTPGEYAVPYPCPTIRALDGETT